VVARDDHSTFENARRLWASLYPPSLAVRIGNLDYNQGAMLTSWLHRLIRLLVPPYSHTRNVWRMPRSDEWHNVHRSQTQTGCKTATMRSFGHAARVPSSCRMYCSTEATNNNLEATLWKTQNDQAPSGCWWCQADELRNSHYMTKGSGPWRVALHHSGTATLQRRAC